MNAVGNMVPVPIESFFQGLKADVDVYIRLNDDKFVLLIRSNETFDLEQLKRYQVKNLTHLFIKKEDYSTFIKRQIVIAGIVIEHDQITNKKKTEVLTHTANDIYKEISEIGFNQETYSNAKQITQHITNFIETQDRMAKIFETLHQLSDEIVKHSIATALFSTMIAKQLGWTRKETLEKINLGAFLHDVGKKELPVELLAKPRDQMNRDELKDYESHPYRGMMILNSMNSIPQDIVSIVYEHHENSIGQGFPRKLKDSHIHPLAKVVGLANCFVDLTIKNATNILPKKAEDAVAYIEVTMGQPFNKESFEALKAIIIKSKTKKSA